MKRVLVTILMTLSLAILTAGPSLAHHLTVDPRAPGKGPVVEQAVSTDWAHAHCEAAAPAVATASSGGVVTFTPDRALDGCPVAPPPGQQ